MVVAVRNEPQEAERSRESVRPGASFGGVVFQPSPREFAAEERLLNEPIYKKARDKIVEFITRLQAARSPEDYVELHRSVLAHFIAYQETADEAVAQRMEIRDRIRELAREEPRPIAAIQEQQVLLERVVNQEATLKAVHHLIRAVVDGIAWRALRYDRRAFTVPRRGRTGRSCRLGHRPPRRADHARQPLGGRGPVRNPQRHDQLSASRRSDRHPRSRWRRRGDDLRGQGGALWR